MGKTVELAGCLIGNAQRGYLLLHRCFQGVSQWELPGGKIHTWESGAEAAAREMEEEINIKLKPGRTLCCHHFEEKGTGFRYEVFEAESYTGEPRINEPEKFDALGFFGLTELIEMELELSANMKLTTAYLKGMQ